MTFGILCSGPDMDRYPPPPNLLVVQGKTEWCWYHDFNKKILYPDRETAERDAAAARRYNPDWKYQVIATE